MSYIAGAGNHLDKMGLSVCHTRLIHTYSCMLCAVSCIIMSRTESAESAYLLRTESAESAYILRTESTYMSHNVECTI